MQRATRILPDFLLLENVHPKFDKGTLVQHYSGSVYEIVLHPVLDKLRLEHNAHPAYGYRQLDGDGPIWLRSVFEMDDGRYTLIDPTA